MDQQPLPDGWYPDPTGRHEERYVHAGEWSAEVRNQGVQATESAPGEVEASTVPGPVKKKRARGCLLGVVLALVGLTVLGFLADDEPSEEERGIAAVLACENFVKAKLKAPGTADFPHATDAVTTHVGDRWRVESHVDSENGFGANLRTGYTCVVVYRPSTDRWTLSDLQLK